MLKKGAISCHKKKLTIIADKLSTQVESSTPGIEIDTWL